MTILELPAYQRTHETHTPMPRSAAGTSGLVVGPAGSAGSLKPGWYALQAAAQGLEP
jgi:hypothetical protein